MSDYVSARKPSRVVLLTECSMSDNVAVQNPDVEFIRPCNLCPHMKRITLANIRRALETNTHIVNVDPLIAARARRAVERMLAVSNVMTEPLRASAATMKRRLTRSAREAYQRLPQRR